MRAEPAPRTDRPSVESFADRLAGAIRSKRSCLVVGLDPVIERLPREVLAQAGVPSPGAPGFTARAAAAYALYLEGVISVAGDFAVAVKPNTAFFERLGAVGWECLSHACRKARSAGLLVIADAKRGDIGHTAEAYSEALLGDLPDTPGPHVDAVTLNPYLGSESMEPFLRRVREQGKGIFVLVRTSNSSAGELQDLDCGGLPLYLRVAELVARWGEGARGACGLSSVGAVVGATAPAEARRVRKALPATPFLVPGYGAQGAAAEQLRACFLEDGSGAIVNASRSILFAFEKESSPWQEAVRRAAREARDEIEKVRSGLLPA